MKNISAIALTLTFHINSHLYFTFHIVNLWDARAISHIAQNDYMRVHIFKMASIDARRIQCEYVLIQIKFRDKFTFCQIHLTDFSIETFLRDGG